VYGGAWAAFRLHTDHANQLDAALHQARGSDASL
jgi:hypothetical protein